MQTKSLVRMNMSRKKKLVNNSGIPQYAIDRFARCVFDDIREDYMKPEVQADFSRWLEERERNKKKRPVPHGAGLVRYLAFFLRGPLGLELGKIGAPLGKYSCS